jgi:hypothetical protein
VAQHVDGGADRVDGGVHAQQHRQPLHGHAEALEQRRQDDEVRPRIPATPLLVSLSVARIASCWPPESPMPAACATNKVAIARWMVLPAAFKLRLNGMVSPSTRRGIPNDSMAAIAVGRAAALEVVPKATSTGSRDALRNAPIRSPARRSAGKTTTATNTNCAHQALTANRPNPISTEPPCSPIDEAMAANTPTGATYITSAVNWKDTCARDSANARTGSDRTPTTLAATPNTNANTTICRMSPRAIASMMLDGNARSTTSATDGATTAVGRTWASRTPSPGRSSATAPQPITSAAVVATSK